MPKYDTQAFLKAFESAFFKLSYSQKEGLSFLIKKINADSFTIAQAAYVLATIYWETGRTFQPIKELRERPTSPRRKNQDRYWLTGEYGRGYVQITWDRNYRKFGLGPDERDKALEPETAYLIASEGMKNGLFTGYKLSDYINSKEKNFIEARRIINGQDKASIIAGVAIGIEQALRGSVTKTKPGPGPVEQSKEAVAEVSESKDDGFVSQIKAASTNATVKAFLLKFLKQVVTPVAGFFTTIWSFGWPMKLFLIGTAALLVYVIWINRKKLVAGVKELVR